MVGEFSIGRPRPPLNHCRCDGVGKQGIAAGDDHSPRPMTPQVARPYRPRQERGDFDERAGSTFLDVRGQGRGGDEFLRLAVRRRYDRRREALCPGEPGPEGSIKTAVFSVGGQGVMCTDSFVKHAFTFTPAFSLFVDCESESELERLFAALGEGGAALMPLADYGFSRRFGWVNDRYGVSWQLGLP